MKEFTKLTLKPYQREALRKAWRLRGFAYLMEQGTGKTLTIIAEALALYAQGLLDCVLVMAPNGVHENWVLNELPASVPDDVAYAACYYTTHPIRKDTAALQRIMELAHPADGHERAPLRWLTISYDALLVERGFKAAEAFVRSGRCMVVADESQRIKNMKSARTKRALNISKMALCRRIATGTAITQSPMDAYAQFEFLGSGLLGQTSLVAFTAHYAHVLPPSHGVVRHIVDKIERASGRKMSDKEKIKVSPQLIAQDELGRPRYKNLEGLRERMEPHSFRVLKRDVLDLPEKEYETRYFHLTKTQRAVYDRMADELRYILDDNTTLITSKLVALSKLRQITSGFLLMRDGTISYTEDNPRLALLHEEAEGETQQGIIWSQYKEEQASIKRVLRELGQTAEVVNGETPMKRRREIMVEFQAGNLQWIDAHPATMSTGFTLTNGKLTYFYSNGFSMDERVQAEDRNHRIGTSSTVTYRDLVAIDTRDDDVVWALQHKLDTAAIINGDPARRDRFRANLALADDGESALPKRK